MIRFSNWWLLLPLVLYLVWFGYGEINYRSLLDKRSQHQFISRKILAGSDLKQVDYEHWIGRGKSVILTFTSYAGLVRVPNNFNVCNGIDDSGVVRRNLDSELELNIIVTKIKSSGLGGDLVIREIKSFVANGGLSVVYLEPVPPA